MIDETLNQEEEEVVTPDVNVNEEEEEEVVTTDDKSEDDEGVETEETEDESTTLEPSTKVTPKEPYSELTKVFNTKPLPFETYLKKNRIGAGPNKNFISQKLEREFENQQKQTYGYAPKTPLELDENNQVDEESFVSRFIEKYPIYKNLDPAVVISAILQKYPQYTNIIKKKSVISDSTSPKVDTVGTTLTPGEDDTSSDVSVQEVIDGKTILDQKSEEAFQNYMNNNPYVVKWRDGFLKEFGYYPTINDSDYDYRGAFAKGQVPLLNEMENKYSWPSQGLDDTDLESKTQPIKWKLDFTKITGEDPDEFLEEETLQILQEDDDPNLWKEVYMRVLDVDPDENNISKGQGIVDINSWVIETKNQPDFNLKKQYVEFYNTEKENLELDIDNNIPQEFKDLINTLEDIKLSSIPYDLQRKIFGEATLGVMEDVDVTGMSKETEKELLDDLKSDFNKIMDSDVILSKKDPKKTGAWLLDVLYSRNNPEAITDYTEEMVVPVINYIFGRFGITASEAGIMLEDRMEVKSINGNSIKINLDPFTEKSEIKNAKKLIDFIKNNAVFDVSLLNVESEYNRYLDVIVNDEEKDKLISEFNKQENELKDDLNNFLQLQKTVEANIEKISNLSDEERRDPLNIPLIAMTLEKDKLLQTEKARLGQLYLNLKNEGEMLDARVGDYILMKSKQGTYIKYMRQKLWEKISGSATGSVTLMADLFIEGSNLFGVDLDNNNENMRTYLTIAKKKFNIKIPPEVEEAVMTYYDEGEPQEFIDWTKTLEQNGDIRSRVIDLQKKGFKGDTNIIWRRDGDLYYDIFVADLPYAATEEATDKYNADLTKKLPLFQFENLYPLNMGPKGLAEFGRTIYEPFYQNTTAYTDLTDQDWWKNTIAEVFGMIGILTSPGGKPGLALTTWRITSMIKDGFDKEMADMNLTEREKSLFIAPMAVVIGALERLGIRNAINSKGAINFILLNVFKKIPRNTKIAPDTLRKLIIQEVDSMVAKGLLTLTAAGFAELETEMAQYASEEFFKTIYKSFNEHFDFNTAETWGDFFTNLLDMGARGFVGGLFFGLLPSINVAVTKADFNGMTRNEFSIFEEIMTSDKSINDAKKFFLLRLKQQMLEGKITKKEAENQMNDFDLAAGIYSQIPLNLPFDSKIELMGLLLKKQNLENTIKSKDKTLSGPLQLQVDLINKKIKEIVGRKRKKDSTYEPVTTKEKEETTSAPMPEKTSSNVELKDGELTIINTKGEAIKMKGKESGDTGNVFETEDSNTPPPIRESSKRNDIRSAVRTIAKSIQRIFPNLNIILTDSTEQFRELVPTVDKRAIAVYMANNNAIVINLETAIAGEIDHEVWHAFSQTKMTKEERAQTNIELARIVAKSLDLDGSENSLRIKKKLENYMNLWKNAPEGLQKEEYMAEVLRVLAQDFTSLPVKTKGKIRQFFETLLEKVGLSSLIKGLTASEADIIQAINTLALDLALGREVDAETLNVLARNKTKKKSKTEVKDEGDKTQLDLFDDEAGKKEDTKKKEEVKKEEVKKEEVKKPPVKKSIDKILSRTPMSGGKFINPLYISKVQLEKLVEGTGYKVFVARNGNFYLKNKNGQIYDNREGDRTKLQTKDERFDNMRNISRLLTVNGYNLKEIEDYLVRRGFKKKEIAEALKSFLPKGFDSIPDGIKLYKRTLNHFFKLVNQNESRRKPLSNQNIVDKVIEFLENQTEFKKQKDRGRKGYSVTQAQLVIEMSRLIGVGTPPTSSKIARIKSLVNGVRRGEVSLREVQKQLKNFLITTLPKTEFTKAEVLSLINQIIIADKSNIKSITAEVIELSTRKNVEYLQNKIDGILKGKYTTRDSRGRVVPKKIDGPTKKIIDEIAKIVNLENITPEIIGKKVEQLVKEVNKINNKDNPSGEELLKKEGLEAAIKLLTAKLNPNTDPVTAVTLSDALKNLEALILLGKERLEKINEKAREKKLKERGLVLSGITGLDIDLTKEGARNALKKEGVTNPTEEQIIDKQNELIKKSKQLGEAYKKKTKDEQKSILQGFLKPLKLVTDFLFLYHDNWKGLMHRILKFDNRILGKNVQEKLVDEKVYEGERRFKTYQLQDTAAIVNKLQEVFGKGFENILRTLNRKIDTGVTVEVLNPLTGEVEQQPLLMSHSEISYWYNQFKDPSTHHLFKNTLGENYEQKMEALTKLLDSRLKKFADWQVEEFFPSVYNRYNEAYKSIYKTDMPWNETYAGRLYIENKDINDINLGVDTDGTYNNSFQESITASSTIGRTNSKGKIDIFNNLDMLSNYLRDMNYFAAMGPVVNDLNVLFNDPSVRNAIINTSGKAVYDEIKERIRLLATRGRTEGQSDRVINRLQTAFVLGKLGLNPVIAVKQLTSIPAYASDIGWATYAKNAGMSIKEYKKLWNEISQNSKVIEYRYKDGIIKQIESFNPEDQPFLLGKGQKIMDLALKMSMFFPRIGDKGAIFFGGIPVYLHYKNQALAEGKTEQEAIDFAIKKFENATSEAQQSSDLSQKDSFQTGGALKRALNAFYTAPRQYFRKIIYAYRDMARIIKNGPGGGKQTMIQNLQQMMTYQFVLPGVFQYVALGLPGVLSEWDEDEEKKADMLRSQILSVFNSIFIMGQIFEGGANVIQGKPWSGKAVKEPGALAVATRFYDLINRALSTKDDDKKTELLQDAFKEAASVFGIPAKQGDQWFSNMLKVMDGDTEGWQENILRMLNFSDYVIGIPKQPPPTPKDNRTPLEKILDGDGDDAIQDIIDDVPQEFDAEEEIEKINDEMDALLEQYGY